jgi:hypothetical protein
MPPPERFDFLILLAAVAFLYGAVRLLDRFLDKIKGKS